jgi:hypothetical protein
MALISRLPGGSSSKGKYISGILQNSTTYKLSWDFIPNYVSVALTSYGGELKTPCIIWRRTGTSSWAVIGASKIHNYYDGSGGTNFGYLSNVNNTGATFTSLDSSDKYVWVAWE